MFSNFESTRDTLKTFLQPSSHVALFFPYSWRCTSLSVLLDWVKPLLFKFFAVSQPGSALTVDESSSDVNSSSDAVFGNKFSMLGNLVVRPNVIVRVFGEKYFQYWQTNISIAIMEYCFFFCTGLDPFCNTSITLMFMCARTTAFGLHSFPLKCSSWTVEGTVNLVFSCSF